MLDIFKADNISILHIETSLQQYSNLERFLVHDKILICVSTGSSWNSGNDAHLLVVLYS